MAQDKFTINPNVIKKWAEERGGSPAITADVADVGPGNLLKLNFNDAEGEKLESISWDHFFDEFDENNLAFKYQDIGSDGQKSKTYSFVDRDDHFDELEAAEAEEIERSMDDTVVE